MKALAVAVLALASVSCSFRHETCDGNFTVSETFTPAEFGLIQEAGARWTRWVGQPLTFERGDLTLCQISRNPNLEDFAGYTTVPTPGTSDIQLRIGGDDTTFLALVTHELGHSLGLHHVYDPGAIMNPVVTPASDFTDADRAECERVRCFK